jgi:hypothetical protein
MAQHAITFYARIGSDVMNLHDEKLMHLAGLQTHTVNTSSAETIDQGTIEPLVKEFGNLFEPHVRRRFFESEIRNMFSCTGGAARSHLMSGELQMDCWDIPQSPVPVATRRPSVTPHLRTKRCYSRKEKIVCEKKEKIVCEKSGTTNRRSRKSTDVFQAGFN